MQPTALSPKPRLDLIWPTELQLDYLRSEDGGGFRVVQSQSIDLSTRDRIVIGRQEPDGEATCDIALADGSVSRRHCELSWSTGRLRLRDLGSTNGVWLAHARLEGSVLLSDGAVFYVGNCPLRTRLAKAVVQVPNTDRLGRMRGSCDTTRAFFSKLERVAPTPLAVLILGETGTGKGEAARTIHELSGRAGPFVKLDCARLPPSLAESEIFGHVQGAFTGATRDKPSPFEQAKGGTLFLDEVGELPALVQQKLLGVLEDRRFTRIGGERPIAVDARVVAATHLDVDRAMEEGRFRSDLYYRLAGVVLLLAPLRDRRSDIPILTRYFLQLAGAEIGRDFTVTDEAMQGLESRQWPGNIRELRNAVQRAAFLSEPDAPLTSADFQLFERGHPGAHAQPKRDALTQTVQHFVHEGLSLKDAVSVFEHRYCKEVLEQEQGNITRAAEYCGYTRTGFVALLKRLSTLDRDSSSG